MKGGILQVFRGIRAKVYYQAQRAQYTQMYQTVVDSLDTFSAPFKGLKEVISYMLEFIPPAADENVPEDIRLAAFRIGWNRIKEVLQPEFIINMFQGCPAMDESFLESFEQDVQQVIKELCTPNEPDSKKLHQSLKIPNRINWSKEKPWEDIGKEEPEKEEAAPPKEEQPKSSLPKVSRKQPKKSSKPKQQPKKAFSSSSDEDDSPSEDGHDAGDDGEFAPKEN